MDNGNVLQSMRFGGLAAATGVVLILVGCGTATQTSGSAASALPGTPSADASVTVSATPAATSASTPAATQVSAAEGAIMMVVADELRLRGEPGIEGAVVGALARGTVVRAIDGPVEAEGFRWYDVVDVTSHHGWAADGDGIDPWLSPIESVADAGTLLSFGSACDVTGPFNAPSTVVLDDGRVILRGSDYGSWSVRRLSAAGMAHLQANVMSSPYLQQSAEYQPVPQAGAEPPGHGLCVFTFSAGTETEPIVVTSVGWFGEQEESAFYEPSPERKALDAIARNLMVIDSVLGESMWEPAAWLPFVAEEYVLWAGPGVGPTPDGVPIVAPDALPFGDLDDFGDPAQGGRCGSVTREEAFELARVLNDAAGAAEAQLNAANFLAFESNGAWTQLVLVPRTPSYELSCDEFGF